MERANQLSNVYSNILSSPNSGKSVLTGMKKYTHFSITFKKYTKLKITRVWIRKGK